jgi:hypothetical protein
MNKYATASPATFRAYFERREPYSVNSSGYIMWSDSNPREVANMSSISGIELGPAAVFTG